MAYPKWFNEVEYLNSKLAQLQKAEVKDAHGNAFISINQVADAFKAAGVDAFNHYNSFGSAEGLAPSKDFNVAEYCAFKLRALQTSDATKAEWAGRTWQDVQYTIAKSGMSLGQHYAQYGALEGVSMSNKFDTNGYLTAKLGLLQKNADTKAEWAGKTVTDLAKAFQAAGTDPYTHYMTFKGATGEVSANATYTPKEPVNPVSQEKEGQTFILTEKPAENVIGTEYNDTFKALLSVGLDASGDTVYDAANSTLNLSDSIDGKAGTDTLELLLSGVPKTDGDKMVVPGGVSIKNVEIVKLLLAGGDGTEAPVITGTALAKSSTYVGAKELWQIDNDTTAGTMTFGDVTVGAGVVAGFESTGVKASAEGIASTTKVIADAGVKDITVALKGIDGATAASGLTFDGTSVATLNVNGNVTTNSQNEFTLTEGTATAVKAINIGLTSNTTVKFAGTSPFDTVTSFNTSTSTGDITADLSTKAGIAAKLNSITGGAAAESFTVDMGAGAKDIKVDMGAGDDTLTLKVNNAADGVGSIELGAGRDTLKIGASALANVTATTPASAEDLTSVMVSVKFNGAEDILNLRGNVTYLAHETELKKILNTATDLFDAATQASNLMKDAKAADSKVYTTTIFGYGDDTYVLQDNATLGAINTGDGIIKLEGVDVLAMHLNDNVLI